MDYLVEPSRAPRPRPENVIVKAFSEDAPPTPNRFATEASRSEHEQADLVLVPCRPGRFGNCREFVGGGNRRSLRRTTWWSGGIRTSDLRSAGTRALDR
jgi:hypothetical protein